MTNTGAIVGVAILGVAAWAYMSMSMPETDDTLPPTTDPDDTLPPTTDPSPVSPTPDTTSDGGSSVMERTPIDCGRVWNSNGERINNTWVKLSDLSMYFDRSQCNLNGAKVKVFADKSYYVAGETMRIAILKKYYYDGLIKKNEWRYWTDQVSEGDEYLSFYIGIEDPESYHKLWNFGEYRGSKIENREVNMDYGGQYSESDDDGYGIVILSIPLTEDDVGRYEVTSKVVLGPYGKIGLNYCGGSSGECPQGRHCNYRKTTAAKKLTVVGSECATPPSDDDGTADAEWVKSHQSFMSEWV